MEELIRARLLAVLSPVMVDWNLSVQDAEPARVVLQLISDVPRYSQDGATGFRVARVQVDAIAASYGATKQLSRAADAALSGWKNGRIEGCFTDSARDLPTQAGAGETLARVSFDVTVNYQEA